MKIVSKVSQYSKEYKNILRQWFSMRFLKIWNFQLCSPYNIKWDMRVWEYDLETQRYIVNYETFIYSFIYLVV